MPGRFHEISVATADIRAAVDFYEQLGFTQAPTTDTWPHPYGVLTDGRLFIGLHQRRAPSPALTFVQPNLARHVAELERRGIDLTRRHTGEEVFNEIGFSDPFGQAVTVIEARTFSPVDRDPAEVSRCGYFGEFSMPVVDFDAAREFWEPLGFVATDESDDPYAHLTLTSDRLDIAFHRPRTADVPLLVFRDPAMPARIEQLRSLEVPLAREVPRGLDARRNAMLESPDGLTLLLLEGDS